MTKMLADLAEVVPGELDKTAPEIIWLQIDTSASNDERDELWPGDDGVTWCSESIGGIEIQYVRADLYTDMAKRLETAERDAARWRYLVSENNKGMHGKYRICWLDPRRNGFLTTDGVSCDGKDEQAIIRIIDAAMQEPTDRRIPEGE